MDVTLKKIAELTGINISTIRFYKDKGEFNPYFKTSGTGKATRYEEKSTVAILLFIAKSYKENLSADQIVELLDQEFGVNVGIVPKNNSTAVAQQDVITAIKEAFHDEVKALEDKIDLLAVEARERDTQSQSRDELIMTNINLIRQQQLNKRSLWNRIFFK